jgi:DNA modification methylase
VIDLTQPWQVITGDCLEVLKQLPDGCVDAVVTDPPYGLGFPYLSYNDTRENLVSLIAAFMPEARRIAKRVLVLCGPTQIGLYPQPDWVANVTWNTTGTHGKYGYNQWTPVLCYGKDVAGFGNVNGVMKSDTLRINGGGGVGFQRSEAEKRHTCPKPITVMDIVIRRMTNENDLVVDPFGGSGTTAVACAKHGRRCIVIEQDPTYADIARRRIAEAVPLGATA